MRLYRHKVTKKWRLIAHLFLLSVTLNVALIATLCYFLYSSPSLTVPVLKEVSTNGERLAQLQKISYSRLLELLKSQETVEEGLKERDLALALLVAVHDFDIQRACPFTHLQKRQVQFKTLGEVPLTLFVGLTDREYQQICRFADQEEWPLTSKGLFTRLKTIKKRPQTLIQAFVLSPHFIEVETLFHRVGALQGRIELMEMLLQGEWKELDHFFIEQKKGQDLSISRHQHFLLNCYRSGSALAGQWFIESYPAVALKQLKDEEVVTLVKQLSMEHPAHQAFAKSVLLMPRPDMVWKVAAGALARKMGVTLTEPYDHKAVLEAFVSPRLAQVQAKAMSQENVQKSVAERPLLRYIVQKGDNFFRIAQLFHVTEEELHRYNPDVTTLTPGMIFLVPRVSP